MLTRDEVERLEKLTAVAGSRWYYSNADDECVSALPAALATIRELVEALDHTVDCEHHYSCSRCYHAEKLLTAWERPAGTIGDGAE